MRYAIASCAILCVVLLAGWLLTGMVARRRGRTLPKIARALLTLVFAVLMAVAGAGAWLSRYYHADATATQALSVDAQVRVVPAKGGYLFDGPGTQSALVFLPGAKVQAEAYAPLMHELAAAGVDCLLVDPPCNIAFLGMPAMESLIAAYPYEHLMLSGHSMGGVAASSYAASHPEECDALVLLASYPVSKLPETLKLCSIIASEDEVLNREAYDEARDLWPSDAREVLIEGANHAGFGSYGAQAGDGQATISQGEQRQQVVEAIVELAQQLEEDS